jgi:hypothetical protein
MTILIAVFATLLLALGCIGWGSLVLSLFRAHEYIDDAVERAALCFAVGLGVVGWVLFYPGIAGVFRPEVFWGLSLFGTIALLPGIHRFRRGVTGTGNSPTNISWIGICLCAALVLVLGMDLLEGISPPADADTLAYHFALPKDFVDAGRVFFVPRALSGAIPLLSHMTFAAALATGGELALTLWAMVTGWAAGLLVFVLARRHLSRDWSLALAVVFLTTPAVLYGGGSGHIEVRCAVFVLASVAFTCAAYRGVSLSLFALAGLCAGFYLGAKFYGLIFVGSAGLVVLCHRDGLRQGLVFGGAAILAGFQWYLWNWMHTGDPIFPTITNLMQFPDTQFWTRDFGLYFTETIAKGELVLDRSLLNWAIYPVLSIFNIAERLEGGRTGLGIFSLLILPLAVAGLCRADLRRREYIIPLAIAFIFFTVWFFSGTTQRTRHLLPIYPLVLIGLFPVAVFIAGRASLVNPLAVAIALTLAVQLGGQAIFSVNYARHIFSAETRVQFHVRNVPGANAAQWINRELPPGAKLGFMNRQLAYLIQRPAYMMHPHIQVIIDSRPTASDGRKFIAQSQKQGLTHFMLHGDWQNPGSIPEQVPFFRMIHRLVNMGCLRQIRRFDTVQINSRTLRSLGGSDTQTTDTVFELMPQRCPKPNR